MRQRWPIEVFAVAERKLVAGTLFFGITGKNLEHYEQKWLPDSRWPTHGLLIHKQFPVRDVL